MRRSFAVCALAAFLLSPTTVSAGDVTAVNVSIPVVAPTKSQPLASTLLSFSIEQDNWPDWSGIDARNEFTYSALQNFARLTGQPPKLRVGADSEDHTVWSPTVTVCQLSLSGFNETDGRDDFGHTITVHPRSTRTSFHRPTP